MEEKGCIGCGCGCFSVLLILSILLVLGICAVLVLGLLAYSAEPGELVHTGVLILQTIA